MCTHIHQNIRAFLICPTFYKHTHTLFLTLAKCVSQGENITHHSQFHLLLYSILCLQLNGPIHWGNRGHLGSCLFQTL